MDIRHCCKPFKNVKCSKNLVNIYASLRSKLKILTNEEFAKFGKICSSCEFRLHKNVLTTQDTDQHIPVTEHVEIEIEQKSSDTQSTSTITSHGESSDSELNDLKKKLMVDELNKSIIPLIETSPFKKRRMGEKNYTLNKTASVVTGIRRVISNYSADENLTDIAIFYEEMIGNIQQNFAEAESLNHKINILTFLPQSMGISKIQEIIPDATDYMIGKAKDYQKLHQTAPISKEKRKSWNTVTDTVKQRIAEFYESDSNSRSMPGKADSISVYQNGQKEIRQKRLMLCTVNETYQKFKEQNPDVKVGKSKFAELRPKQCIILGSNIHNVCLCAVHQNFKLMCENSKLRQMMQMEKYEEFIDFVLCSSPNPACYLLHCKNCYTFDNLREKLTEVLKLNKIIEIRYKQWDATDRCSLNNHIEAAEDFVDIFIQKLKKLIPHHFIAKQQSVFFKETKNSLSDGEFFVQLDFSENYSFVVQSAVAGYHWNNSQSTIHPFEIYYKENDSLQHVSFIVISDIMNHDSITVHLFITKMIEFLKSKFSHIKKIIYASDGAASQYKNKYNFINLLNHEKDFGIPCEWHFHATAHGKGPCDAIGGTLKRAAARNTLSRELENQITTPRLLYDWAITWQTNLVLSYCDKSGYEEFKQRLAIRYANAKLLKGTQSYHAFLPISDNRMMVKRYSKSRKSISYII